MQEVIIKKDNKITCEEEIHHFLNPKFVFVPLLEGYKPKVVNDEYVYMYDILAMNRKGDAVFAPISGRVLGLKRMNYLKNSDVPSIVIENDFKENVKVKKSGKRNLHDYTLSDIIKILRDYSCQYKKVPLALKLATKTSCLIINGVEIDAYFENKHAIMRENLDDILEIVDLLASLLKVEKTYFVLKNTDSFEINKLMSFLGTYPNIELKLISPAYPNGLPARLKTILKEEKATVFDVQEIDILSKVLRRTRPVSTRLLTITGPQVQPRRVIHVKTGSLLSEIFVSNFDFTCEEVDVYINGYPFGEKVTDLKYVIDDDIDGIYIDEHTPHEETPCLNCGQCSKSCPMGLNPKYVFDHAGQVDCQYYETCLQCGLCNYVCPAYRDLKKCMKECGRP